MSDQQWARAVSKPAFLKAHSADSISRSYVDEALTASGIDWADVPEVPDLDAAILEQIAKKPKCFDMTDWHCGTTHCRAGWAVTLGKARRLENTINLACDRGKFSNEKSSSNIGAEVMGAAIYIKSCPRLPVPDFRWLENHEAITDMQRRAKRQARSAAKAVST